MKTDTMFGKLDSYADAAWAGEHISIDFDTPKEHRTYRVFAVFRTKVGAKDEYKYYEKVGELGEEDYAALIAQLSEISMLEFTPAPAEKTQILMLSTCSYYTQDGRFVVAACKTD